MTATSNEKQTDKEQSVVEPEPMLAKMNRAMEKFQSMDINDTNFPNDVVSLLDKHELLFAIPMPPPKETQIQYRKGILGHVCFYFVHFVAKESQIKFQDIYHFLRDFSKLLLRLHDCANMLGAPDYQPKQPKSKQDMSDLCKLMDTLFFPKNDLQQCAALVDLLESCGYFAPLPQTASEAQIHLRNSILSKMAHYRFGFIVIPGSLVLLDLLREVSFTLDQGQPENKVTAQALSVTSICNKVFEKVKEAGQGKDEAGQGNVEAGHEDVLGTAGSEKDLKALDCISEKNKAQDIKALFSEPCFNWSRLLNDAIKTRPVYIVEEIFARAPKEEFGVSTCAILSLVALSLQSKKSDITRFLLSKFEMDVDTMQHCQTHKWGTLSSYDADLCKELIERFNLGVSCFAHVSDLLRIHNVSVVRFLVERFNLNNRATKFDSNFYQVMRHVLMTWFTKDFVEWLQIARSVLDDTIKLWFVSTSENIMVDCIKLGDMQRFNDIILLFHVNQALLYKGFKVAVEVTPEYLLDINMLRAILKIIKFHCC